MASGVADDRIVRSVEHRVLLALRIKFVAGSFARETGRGLGGKRVGSFRSSERT